MNAMLHIAAAVALVGTVAVAVTRCPVHALRWLALSLLAVAVPAYAAAAPIAAAVAAALPVGALALASRVPDAAAVAARERRWLAPRVWVVPAALTMVVLAELVYVLSGNAAWGTIGAPAALADVPLVYGMSLAAVLFALGLLIVLVRRSIVFMLMGLVIMLSAAGLALVLGGHRWGRADGQILLALVPVITIAVSAVGAGLALRVVHRRGGIDRATSPGQRR